jgi:hypothetical protein
MVSLTIPAERINNGLYEENVACKVSARLIPSQKLFPNERSAAAG